jgi:hypothetical protein
VPQTGRMSKEPFRTRRREVPRVVDPAAFRDKRSGAMR